MQYNSLKHLHFSHPCSTLFYHLKHFSVFFVCAFVVCVLCMIFSPSICVYGAYPLGLCSFSAGCRSRFRRRRSMVCSGIAAVAAAVAALAPLFFTFFPARSRAAFHARRCIWFRSVYGILLQCLFFSLFAFVQKSFKKTLLCTQNAMGVQFTWWWVRSRHASGFS